MHTILSIFISLSLLSPTFTPITASFPVLTENETPTESDNPSPDAAPDTSMPDASTPDASTPDAAPGASAPVASAPVALSAPSALLMIQR